MRRWLIAAFLTASPARAFVARVPELKLGVPVAAPAAAAFAASASAVATVFPSSLRPSAPEEFEAGTGAPAPASAAPAADPRYDLVLDLDETIIGRPPHGESADGLPLEEAETVAVHFQNSLGQLHTSSYLVRKGFKEFVRRARADPNVRGIHIVSGSSQDRLNMLAQAIVIDGRPLAEYADTLIGREFLLAYSPETTPGDSRPIKDISLLGLKNIKEIDAALRRGDIEDALAVSRELVAPRARVLAERRVLVVDDSPERVLGGSATVIRGVMAFKPAEDYVPRGADPEHKARIMAMRRAFWEHQNGEFDELSGLLGRGLIPGSPEWKRADSSRPAPPF